MQPRSIGPVRAPMDLAVPIVLAPMAGGPSTPELAAAVSEAGGLGFLAAGYNTADAMAGDVAATRALTRAPFGSGAPTAFTRPFRGRLAVREEAGGTLRALWDSAPG